MFEMAERKVDARGRCSAMDAFPTRSIPDSRHKWCGSVQRSYWVISGAFDQEEGTLRPCLIGRNFADDEMRFTVSFFGLVCWFVWFAYVCVCLEEFSFVCLLLLSTFSYIW